MYLAVGLARHDCLTGCGLAKKESALKLRYPGLRSDLRALISFTGFFMVVRYPGSLLHKFWRELV